MANQKPKKAKGEITLKSVPYNYFLPRLVIKNNDTSGKVSLPKELIGKQVYVVWQDD
ncbi:MAG: DUF2080 family transposase-associated protein [Nanoarchaeota archaeon]